MTETVGSQLDAQERAWRERMLSDRQAFAYFTMGARSCTDAIGRGQAEAMRQRCEEACRAVEAHWQAASCSAIAAGARDCAAAIAALKIARPE